MFEEAFVEINLPNHIGIIPDGNRRWAAEKGLTQVEGHFAGAENMHRTLDKLIDLGIRYVTTWGFSTDNWRRNDQEVNSIFNVLETWINRDLDWLHSKNVKLRHVGRLHELPVTLIEAITRAVIQTRDNTGLILNLAFNYSGRAEIVDIFKRLLGDGVPADSINENMISESLARDCMPDVDLVIRTAGELRVSNFMLWQTAYSEYFFSPLLWPDFDETELDKSLVAYSDRSRRFGGD